MEVFKGGEFKNGIYFVLISLFHYAIFVLGRLNLVNSGWLNFWKYAPQRVCIQ